MSRTLAVRIVGVVLLATGTAATGALPAAADTGFAAPEMLSAMQRDLGLTADQARERVASELKAAAVENSLATSLGTAFAGAHFEAGQGKLVVNVTDSAKTAAVEAAGATAKVVQRSGADLDAAKARLQNTKAPKAVTGSYVDVATNNVVIEVLRGEADQAKQFAATAGVDAAAVRIVEAEEAPRPMYDIRGGDKYLQGTYCSVGFSVPGGFITAGHCGDVGTKTTSASQVAQGEFTKSSFPGNDYAFVETNSDWTPTGVVNRYNGSTVKVTGSTEAAVGASVCRSGATTGWRCGTIQSKNATVYYPNNETVYGLTKTNACAEGGDSGGSWLAGTQAQGVTSGGSGNCTRGGTTYFQPVNEILSAYSLSLITS